MARTHYARPTALTTLCGQSLTSRISLTFDGVNCEACKKTNWWRDSTRTNTVKLADDPVVVKRVHISGDFVNGIEAAVTRVKNLSIFTAKEEICKECREPVKMICMTGTGYCSMNCQEIHESLNPKENT
jgi:hypothetical protein